VGFTFSTWIGFASAPQAARHYGTSGAPALRSKNDRFNSADPKPQRPSVEEAAVFARAKPRPVRLRDTAARVLPMCFPVAISGKQHPVRVVLSA